MSLSLVPMTFAEAAEMANQVDVLSVMGRAKARIAAIAHTFECGLEDRHEDGPACRVIHDELEQAREAVAALLAASPRLEG